jgi:enoyl-CoA hydratase
MLVNSIEYTITEGIGVLRVNRPEARNALNWQAQDRFAALIQEAAADRDLRALILTGAGEQAFVAGGDLKELANHPEPEAGERLNRTMSAALAQMMALPLPVIAAINGDALGGGCEIITACDLRIVGAQARLGFVQIRNALTTGWGGGGRLVRLVGQSRAMELLLTGRLLTASEAQAIGLVHRVVPAGEDVLDAAFAWARQLLLLPREALAALKSLVQTAGQEDVDAYEAELFVKLWSRPDHLEALRAFVEKRRPVFNRSQMPDE